MSVTDPELHLMLELLDDDPGDDSVVAASEALLARGRPRDALRLLERGLSANPHLDAGWVLLVTTAMALGKSVTVLEAMEHIDTDASSNPDMARLRIRALVGTRQASHLRAACERFLSVHPEDAEVAGILERIHAGDATGERTARDPFVSVSRAEAYARCGRVDKAIRAYRRILARYPHDRALETRLMELAELPLEREWREDDLSEEVLASDFTASGPAPHIDMPTPSIVGPEEEITQPHSIEEIEAALRLLAERREQLLEGESGASFGADEDESTVRIKRPGGPGGGR